MTEAAERSNVAAPALVVGSLLTLWIAIPTGHDQQGGYLAALLIFAAVLARRTHIPWEQVLVLLVLVLLFLPIRRYVIPGNLPFQLEPYRALVAVVLFAWFGSLLVDSRTNLRRTALDGPLFLIVAVAIGSVVTNADRVGLLEDDVLKTHTFFLSFVLLFFFIVSVVREHAAAERVVKALVAGGAVVAVFAVIESRTGVSPFTHLDRVLPFLEPDPRFDPTLSRGARMRAFGSAEHPIALGALLVMLLPLAVYLVHRTRQPRWWIAGGALFIGVFATVSRTGIVMLIPIALVFLCLRPRQTMRLWPLLLPLLAAIHFALPGTLGTIKESFLPTEGLVEQQRADRYDCGSSGRIADLDPALRDFWQKPLLGYGFGTRVVRGPETNACIFDNQWLATLIEEGAFGIVAWVWLFLCAIRRFGRGAAADVSSRGWLLVAVIASIAAYAIGMFTFDAFTFIQVTLVLFILLGLGASTLATPRLRAVRVTRYLAQIKIGRTWYGLGTYEDNDEALAVCAAWVDAAGGKDRESRVLDLQPA